MGTIPLQKRHRHQAAQRYEVDRSANRARLYLLAFLWPFAAAVIAVLRPRAPEARNLMWIFVVFYGAVFYLGVGSSSDSVRYAHNLMVMHQDWFELSQLTSQFFAEGSRYQDIYQPLVTFFVSRLTDQYWLLFAAFGVLFGYVYSRNIWFLVDRIEGRAGLLMVFLVLSYAFFLGIGPGLNGVRMWTALHVFVFGFLHYYATGNRKFLLVILLSPLIHFSFWLPVGVLFGFFFVKAFGLPIYGFFLVSYVASWIDLAAVQTLMSYLPLQLEQRSSGYIGLAEMRQDGMVEVGGASAWFLGLNASLRPWFFLLMVSWMVWRGCLLKSGLVRNLLVFGMLMYGVVNMLSYIPSLGRFYSLAGMILLAGLILWLADRKRPRARDRQIVAGLASLLFIHLALGIRMTLEWASIWLLAGNFLIAPFVSADRNLYEFFAPFVRFLI